MLSKLGSFADKSRNSCGLAPPILLGLARHSRGIPVLDFEPVGHAAGTIGGAEPLRHDAFAAEPAGVLEDYLAVALVVLIEDDPRMQAAN